MRTDGKIDRQWFQIMIIYLIGILFFSAVLWAEIPAETADMLPSGDSDFIFLSAGLLLYLAYRLPGRGGSLVAFTATLGLFAFPLAVIWNTGKITNFFLIGGLLPVSDATNYYRGALQLLEGWPLTVAASYRPFFSGTLAAFLGLTGQNLQWSVAVFVLINAVAAFFFAREIQRSFGPAAGVFVLVVVFMFYRDFIGTLMTENLGLALGLAGIAILWKGVVNRHINFCLLGIFILTLALNARAGTFFVLPALIMWGALVFRNSRRYSRHFLLGGVGAVLFGFLLNFIVFELTACHHCEHNANFSYTLYGLTAGGRWNTVFTDHPEIEFLSEKEKAKKVYRLALKAFYSNPLTLMNNCFRVWKVFLWDGFSFSFIRSEKLITVLQVFSILSLISCVYQRNKIHWSFLAFSAIGIVLSVPFLPPWDGGERVYAATIPLFSVFPALGFVSVVNASRYGNSDARPGLFPVFEQPACVVIFGIGLALLSTIGPLTARALNQHPRYSEIDCPAGTETLYFRNSHGSSIHLVDTPDQRTYLPDVQLSDFKQDIDKYNRIYNEFPELVAIAQELDELKAHTTIISKAELNKDAARFLPTFLIIAKTDMIPKQRGIIGACGKRSANPVIKGTHGNLLFYADSMKLLQ